MPSYTTAEKVRNLYPKLDSVPTLTNNQIDFYINQAESEIDGRIANRYTLPFSTTPALLETLSTEYSLIKVLDRFFTSETRSKSDWREIRRREIINLLTGIADGSIVLINSDSAVISEDTDLGGISSNTKDYVPTFNHLDVSLQQWDSDRLDAEEDELD